MAQVRPIKTMSIANILKSIGDFISKLLPWAKTAINHGKDIANEIKTIVDNPAWDVVVSLTSTKLDDTALATLRIWLAQLLVDLNLSPVVNSIEGDSLAIGAIYKNASTAIKDMIMPEAKAGTLNTIAAAASTKVAELKGNVLPIETTLAAQQPAYKHPELLND